MASVGVGLTAQLGAAVGVFAIVLWLLNLGAVDHTLGLILFFTGLADGGHLLLEAAFNNCVAYDGDGDAVPLRRLKCELRFPVALHVDLGVRHMRFVQRCFEVLAEGAPRSRKYDNSTLCIGASGVVVVGKRYARVVSGEC